ncbi:MAG: AAA family ATPase [Candidatus Pacebacteria bacterium]|nr:AAA family ATPase [Candidatus Paceibacterota bacterium]MBP9840746.1 AAA family ATPase [Candidatus Paceibacterota bacterium]
MILGIAGTIGAGKGTVVDYLKEKGFKHYSSSDTLRKILKERGEPDTRLAMSTLADELMNEYPGGVLTMSYERAMADGAQDFILEAIHRETEAAYVRSVGGRILGVDAGLKTRYERTVKRGDGGKDAVTFEEFVENSKREDEGQGSTGANIRAVIASADATVTNDGTLEDLRTSLGTALAKLG